MRHVRMRTGLRWSVLALLTMVPASARAQGLDEIGRLSLQNRRLTIGSEAAGTLTAEDAKWVDGTYAQAWGIELQRGQSVTVDLLSDDFDSYLLIGGPGFDEHLSDDDGAGACDARLTFEAPETGLYRVVVNTIAVESVGRFRVRVSTEPGPITEGSCRGDGLEDPDAFAGVNVEWLRSLPTDGRSLRVGQEFPGALSEGDSVSGDGSHVQAWALNLNVGDRVVIDLLSEAFDPFLMFIGPGMEDPLYDDDGAGGCYARIDFTAGASGTYRVVANSIGEGAVGRFRLRVTTTPGPTMEGDCADISSDWLNDLPVAGRMLELGREHGGELSTADAGGPDGSWVQAWELQLRGGVPSVTVDVLSDDFDAFLFVVAPDGEIWRDDDGAGACDSRVTLPSPGAGRYRIVVNTTLPGQTGRYRVRVTETPGPRTAGDCGG
jgi:hypothetical protein